MITPNQITTLRLLIFFVGSFLIALDWHYWVGFGFFVVGGLTDRLDGYVARKYNLATAFGSLYDQLSDKIAALFVLVALVEGGVLPAWFLGLVLLRDFAMTGIRDYGLLVKDTVIAAKWYGKRKSDVMWLALLVLLVAFKTAPEHLALVRAICMGIVLLVCYASLAGYVLSLRGLPRAPVDPRAADGSRKAVPPART